MKLYYAPRTRAVRPRWLLEELQVPYQLVRIDLANKEQKMPGYLAVHPHGTVPALEDSGEMILESLGICLYLADRFPDKKLAPAPLADGRASYMSWMAYSLGTIEHAAIDLMLHSNGLPAGQRSQVLVERGRNLLDESFAVVSKGLGKNDYLVNNAFSAADVVIGGNLFWLGFMGTPPPQQNLQAYVSRLTSRPGFKRAMAD
jgi:glutathione S-transferase